MIDPTFRPTALRKSVLANVQITQDGATGSVENHILQNTNVLVKRWVQGIAGISECSAISRVWVFMHESGIRQQNSHFSNALAESTL